MKDYACTPVPNGEGRPLFYLLAVFIAFTVNIASLILGAEIGMNSSFTDVILGSLIGGGILSIIGMLTSYIGGHVRMSTGMLNHIVFGVKGTHFFTFLFAVTLFGWFGIQTEVFAISLDSLFIRVFDLKVSRLFLIFLGGILMSTTAIIGYKALEKLSLICVPLLFILTILPLVNLIFAESPALLLSYHSEIPFSLEKIISLVVGSFVVGAVIMPDIMRYARTKKDASLVSFYGFFMIYPLLLILAAALAILTQEKDYVQILLSMGLGIPALLIIIFATWTTNDSNLYSSSLSLASIFKEVKKWKLAAFAGFLGTIFAAFGILNYFIEWLILLGLFIAPVGGALIGDYFSNRKRYLTERDLRSFRWDTIFAWLMGVIFGFSTTPVSENGFQLFELTSISSLDGLLVSCIIIFIFNKIKRINA